MSFINRAKDHYFTINGRSSADWDIVVSNDNGYDAPPRDVESIPVPGRNGNLHIDRGRWENVEKVYNDCVIQSGFAEKMDSFRAYLATLRGYQRLEDTFHPNEYRLATFDDGLEVKTIGTRYNNGVFDLRFNCKPQRFLKSGEEPVDIIPVISEGSRMWTPKYKMKGSDPYQKKYFFISILKAPTDSVQVMIRWYNPSYGDGAGYTDQRMLFNVGQRRILVDDYGSTGTTGWSIYIDTESGSTADDYLIQLEGYMYDEATDSDIPFQGTWGRNFYITNPTGFESRPTFRCYGAVFPLRYVILENGENWGIICNDYSHVTTEVFIDCENEYMFYIDSSGNKKNLTDYMTISHADEDGNTLPASFPKLGEGETQLYVYGNIGNKNLLVRLYPHWYTV